MLPPVTTKYILFLLKFVVTVGILTWIASQFHLGAAFEHSDELSWPTVAAVVGLMVLQLFLSGHRLMLALRLMEARLAPAAAMQVTMIGSFFSQTVISFVAGDAMRVLFTMRHGISFNRAASGILLDRALGLIAMILMFLVGIWPLLGLLDEWSIWSATFFVALLAGGAVVTFFLLTFIPPVWRAHRLAGPIAEYASISRHVLARPITGSQVLLQSAAINSINVMVIFVLARGMNLQLGLLDAFVLIPPVILLSMMPISIAGWGVREGAMVVALGLIGLQEDKVLAVSILFGLASLAISLPGGIVWLLSRKTGSVAHAGGKMNSQKGMG